MNSLKVMTIATIVAFLRMFCENMTDGDLHDYFPSLPDLSEYDIMLDVHSCP